MSVGEDQYLDREQSKVRILESNWDKTLQRCIQESQQQPFTLPARPQAEGDEKGKKHPGSLGQMTLSDMDFQQAASLGPSAQTSESFHRPSFRWDCPSARSVDTSFFPEGLCLWGSSLPGDPSCRDKDKRSLITDSFPPSFRHLPRPGAPYRRRAGERRRQLADLQRMTS